MERLSSADILQYYWPDWHIIRQIGHGSFGDVFECDKADGVRPSFFGAEMTGPDAQTSSGENIAVKRSAIKVISIPQHESQIAQLRAEGIDADSTTAYFEKIAEDCVREIKTMESVKSCPNVVYIEDFKVAPKPDGIGWSILIRMELLTSLPDYLETHKMSETDVIKLGMDLCNALVTCHKKNIIHRDIKPGNIMVNENGDFKLADFGIARELDKSELGLSKKGTYSYMAPEMELMDTYDHRVDLYALGIVLYQLLNNNRAPFLNPFDTSVSFESKNQANLRRIRGETIPAPLNGSSALKDIVMCACAFSQEDRFTSAAQMLEALRNASMQAPAAGFSDDPHTPQLIDVPQDTGATHIGAHPIPLPPKLHYDPIPPQQPHIDPPPENENQNNSTKTALIILAAAVAFCAILAGIYLGLSKDKDDDTTVATQEESVTEVSQQTTTQPVSNIEIPLTNAPTTKRVKTTTAPTQLIPGNSYLASAALKLRGGPGTTYTDLGTVAKGTVVRYLGQQGNNYSYVEYYVGGVYHQGWVLTSYLKNNTTAKDFYNGVAPTVTTAPVYSTLPPITTTTQPTTRPTTTRPTTAEPTTETEPEPTEEEPSQEEPVEWDWDWDYEW